MSDFNTAVNLVLNHEGGLSNDSSDPGGLTNFGISLRWHPELGADGIRNLTREQAAAIYQKEYWTAAMEQEPDQRMGNALLDTAVNQGPAIAAQFYQHFGHSIKEFQLARLLRYAALNKPQDNHSWFERTLDV